jgi:hypothetical protein
MPNLRKKRQQKVVADKQAFVQSQFLEAVAKHHEEYAGQWYCSMLSDAAQSVSVQDSGKN